MTVRVRPGTPRKSPVIQKIAGLLHFQSMRFYVIGLTNIQVTMFLEAVPSLE